MAWQTVTITIELSSVIRNDIDGFNDLLAELAFNDTAAQEIDYTIVGHSATTVDLEVTANIGDYS